MATRVTSDLGVTGDRAGPTHAQLSALARLLFDTRATTLHHGDCLGVDSMAHDLARIAGMRVVVHPPSDAKLRAHCKGDVIHPEAPYLERNRSMVDAIDHLIAVPRGPERLRSGTWATVRYARTRGVPTTIIRPDGRAEPDTEGGAR